jgi:hypothetical protein
MHGIARLFFFYRVFIGIAEGLGFRKQAPTRRGDICSGWDKSLQLREIIAEAECCSVGSIPEWQNGC